MVNTKTPIINGRRLTMSPRRIIYNSRQTCWDLSTNEYVGPASLVVTNKPSWLRGRGSAKHNSSASANPFHGSPDSRSSEPHAGLAKLRFCTHFVTVYTRRLYPTSAFPLRSPYFSFRIATNYSNLVATRNRTADLDSKSRGLNNIVNH